MLGVFKAIGTTVRAAFRRPVTVQYPNHKKELPHRSRGFPVLLWDEKVDEPFCTGCQVCARYCPVDCMTVVMKDNPKHAAGESKRKKIVEKFYIDYARCMRCDICVEVCNFDAIVMNNTWEGIELSRFDRQDLVMDLPMLLRQHKTGDLEDPFREPMGVAHSGWTPKTEEEHKAAEKGTGPDAAPASAPGGQPVAEDAPSSAAATATEAPPEALAPDQEQPQATEGEA